MNVDFITKLGGSALTEKSSFETLNEATLHTAAKVLGECYKRGQRFVVIHGAGSFGHHQAREYCVNKGYTPAGCRERVKEGFCKTRLSVCKLNLYVIKALVDHGVPAVSLPPCNSWRTDGGVVTENGTATVIRHLKEGYIPCLHGDCVLDESQGCKILSGDTIIWVLCEALRPLRVVFLTDVPGIYSKPPTDPGATLLHNIRVKADGTFDVAMETSTEGHDVTGGIRLKLDTAIQIVLDHKGPVYICSLDADAFHNACIHGNLDGRPGTVVQYHDV